MSDGDHEHLPHPVPALPPDSPLAEARAIAEEATARLRRLGHEPRDLSDRLSHLASHPEARPSPGQALQRRVGDRPGTTPAPDSAMTLLLVDALERLLERKPTALVSALPAIVRETPGTGPRPVTTSITTAGLPGQPVITEMTTAIALKGDIPGTTRIVHRTTGELLAVIAEDPLQISPPPAPPQTPVSNPPWWQRGRTWRYLGAAFLLLLALWTVIIPGMFPVSSNAAVNARLLTVRSPINGTATRATKNVGDAVKPGEVLLRIHNDRIDTSRLDSLATQRTNLLARRDALGQELESRQREADACRTVITDFSHRIRTDLEQRLVEAQANVRRTTAILTTAESALNRLLAVRDQIPGGISASEWEKAQSLRDQARQDAVANQAGAARVSSLITSIDAHQYLEVQAPYQVERLVVVESLIADLEVKGAETRRNLTDLDVELAKEQDRTSRLREAVLESATTGLVWKIQANADQFLPAGAEVMQIAEGGSIAIEAWLHQRYLDEANVGDRAIVYLTGDRRRLDGTVTAVDVEGQTTADETRAYPLTADSPKSFKVTIQLDRNSYTTAMIGQRAKVLLCGRHPGLGASLLLWFYALVEF